MANEIERKFLVRGDTWRPGPEGILQRQGYLSVEDPTVRVRIEGPRATLTVKGAQKGLTRPEFEYGIPLADAEEMLLLCAFAVEKTRYVREFGGRRWEIDVFHGANEGLVIAELELAREDESFALPLWLGAEVSRDPRYRVSSLARNPFGKWDRC
ncbi:MAG: CYTH domain-containing protein [Planctomycetes bacterium]|nr:CYTH domain-containing protein [Planctomycetota bacterium]